MINLDAYVTAFISQNWITISMALGLLKIIAKMTPCSHDDSIAELLTGVFGMVKGGRK